MTSELFIVEVNIAKDGEEPIWDYEQCFGGEDGNENLDHFLDNVDYSYDCYDVRIRKIQIADGDGQIIFEKAKLNESLSWDEFIERKNNGVKNV